MYRWSLGLISKAGAFLLAGYIAWTGWAQLGPRKPDVGPVRRDLADEAVSRIVEDIRTSRGDIRRATLLHFENDPADYFTDVLRRVIERRGTLNLGDRPLTVKARDVLNLQHPAYASADEALARGRQLGAPAVLYGTLHAFESYPGGAKLDVEVALADVSTGETVLSKRYRLEVPPAVGAETGTPGTGASWSLLHRLFGWLIAVLLLPVFTITFIRTVVRKESNWSNAFVLGVYTAADALLGWLLFGPMLGSWWAVPAFVVAVGLAFAYNVRVMTFALRLET